jgi:hypothetical protein
MLVFKNLQFPYYNNFAINQEKKTSVSGPPKQNDKKACFGSYCIRSTVKKVNEFDEIVNVYHGYSQDIEEIVEAVENICDRRKKENEKCRPASLVFLKRVENCQGMITENDKYGNNPLILRFHS